MQHNNLRSCKFSLVMAALFALSVQPAPASNAPLVSGSYQVLQNRDLGSQLQIRLRIHLANPGPFDVSIRRMTLWDFSHPGKVATQTCVVVLGAHASAETTLELTLPKSEYQLWQKGLRPRFVLEMGGPGSARIKTVVRLDRISGQEAK